MSRLKQRLTDDIKAAMLTGDAASVECLRGLKSAILYAEVAAGKRDDGLNDNEIEVLFAKEAKKRQESADLFVQGGSQERADKELSEKLIIEQYLPKQLSAEEIRSIVENVMQEVNPTDMSAMGQIIGEVKKRCGSAADGALIAKVVKEKLS